MHLGSVPSQWLVEVEPPIFIQFYRSGELRHTEILDKAQVPDGTGPRYLVFVDNEAGDVTEYDRLLGVLAMRAGSTVVHHGW